MADAAYLTYYQRNRYLVLNKAKNITKTIKVDWASRQEKNVTTCLKKKKIKKREYGKNRYHTMSEGEKIKKREYEKNRYNNSSEEEEEKKENMVEIVIIEW